MQLERRSKREILAAYLTLAPLAAILKKCSRRLRAYFQRDPQWLDDAGWRLILCRRRLTPARSAPASGARR